MSIQTNCALFAGRWTVDMFAMFHLGRPDVFPLGDLAVRKGLQELYKLKVLYLSNRTVTMPLCVLLMAHFLKSWWLSREKPLQACL